MKVTSSSNEDFGRKGHSSKKGGLWRKLSISDKKRIVGMVIDDDVPGRGMPSHVEATGGFLYKSPEKLRSRSN